MVKRWLLAAAALSVVATLPANAGWYQPYSNYTAIPPPGPVHALHPGYVRPVGIAPDHLGVYHERVQIGKVCRFGEDYYLDRCWLDRHYAVGEECGCPPPTSNSPWVRGVVTSQ